MKTQKTFVLSVFTAGLIAAPALAASAQSCCGSGMDNLSGCPMSGHGTSSTAPQQANAGQHSTPFACVFDYYLHIQTALAGDSLAGVTNAGETIAKVVNADTTDPFPPAIAHQAEAVANAQDLNSARAAFKSLSDSLIKFLADHNEKGAYVEVYCPMANAHWLQADSHIRNPYLGKQMLECGEIQN